MVDGLGLTDVEMDSVITLVHIHVEGTARRKVEASQTEQRTGITDAQWWKITGPIIAAVFNPELFPVADRVGRSAGQEFQAAYDPRHAYTFGLDRILDGITALIDSRTNRPGL